MSVLKPEQKQEDFVLPEETEENNLVSDQEIDIPEIIPELIIQEDPVEQKAQVVNFPIDDDFSKSKDSFLFNFHELTITEGNRTPITIYAYVYPRDPFKKETMFTDIVVCFKLDNMYRMGQSGENVKAVDLEIKDYRFIVRGSFKNGEFVTTFNSMNPDVKMSEEITKISPTQRTSTFFKVLEIDDHKFEIFPLSLKNGKDGLVPSIGYLTSEDESRVVFPDGSNNLTIVTEKVRNILTYWQGNSFVCSIE